MRITRSLSLMLYTSLALNVLLGGLWIGQWFFDGKNHPRRAGQFDRQAARAELSESSQVIVDKIWAEHRKKMKSRIKNSLDTRQQVQSLLLSENFDRKALTEAQKMSHNSSRQAKFSVHDVIADIADALPDAERKKYFETGFSRLKKRLDRKRAAKE